MWSKNNHKLGNIGKFIFETPSEYCKYKYTNPPQKIIFLFGYIFTNNRYDSFAITGFQEPPNIFQVNKILLRELMGDMPAFGIF